MFKCWTLVEFEVHVEEGMSVSHKKAETMTLELKTISELECRFGKY